MLLPQMHILTDRGFVPVAQLGDTPVANFDPETAQLVGYTPATSEQFLYAGRIVTVKGTIEAQIAPPQYLYMSWSASPHLRRHPEFERVLLYCDSYLIYTPMRWARGGAGTQLDDWIAPYPGSDVDWARLIGFMVGDGHASSKHVVAFHLKRQRKIDWVRQICDRLDLELQAQQHDRYALHLDGIGDWCRQQLYCPDGAKRIPESFLKARQPVIEGLIDGLMASDGYKNTLYTTTSRQVADMLQALGGISGLLFSLREQKTCYRLYRIRRLQYSHLQDARGSQTTLREDDYRGPVYDVITKTGLILVRMGLQTALIGTKQVPEQFRTDKDH